MKFVWYWFGRSGRKVVKKLMRPWSGKHGRIIVPHFEGMSVFAFREKIPVKFPLQYVTYFAREHRVSTESDNRTRSFASVLVPYLPTIVWLLANVFSVYVWGTLLTKTWIWFAMIEAIFQASKSYSSTETLFDLKIVISIFLLAVLRSKCPMSSKINSIGIPKIVQGSRLRLNIPWGFYVGVPHKYESFSSHLPHLPCIRKTTWHPAIWWRLNNNVKFIPIRRDVLRKSNESTKYSLA